MNIKPKFYTKLINFKITPEEHEILKLISETEQKTSSDLFRTFIKEKQEKMGIYLNKESNQQPALF